MTEAEELKALEEANADVARYHFREQFIAAFLGAWCAKHYEDYCARDMHDSLRRPPVEDAAHLADEAWARRLEHRV